MAINAEVGGAEANCYVTLTEADEWHAVAPGAAAWKAASATEREAALIAATRQVDAHTLWGAKNTTEQALFFPRSGDYDTVTGAIAVPVTVKRAVMEQALYLLQAQAELVDRAEIQHAGVQNFTLNGISEGLRGARISDGWGRTAWQYIRRYVKRVRGAY